VKGENVEFQLEKTVEMETDVGDWWYYCITSTACSRLGYV